MVTKESSASTVRPNWRTYGVMETDVVLKAAIDAFDELGYHGSTVRDIARRCGLSVAGIYHYYDGKQDMLYAILSRTMRELAWRSAAALAEAGEDPVARFSFLIESLALQHTHRAKMSSIGASEMRSLTPRNRRHITAMRTAHQRLVDAEVDSAVASGAFTTAYPHEASRAVVTLCTALPNWFHAAGPLTPEETAARYVQLSLDAMGFPPLEESSDRPPGGTRRRRAPRTAKKGNDRN